MVRTLISLNPQDKKWLDKQAKAKHVPMTEIVREAVSLYRHKVETEKEKSFEELLQQTAGLWVSGDGLKYQLKLRDEWGNE